jgi:hypothetical protein
MSNPLQGFVDAMSAVDREVRSQYHLTLRQLIGDLEKVGDQTKPVRFSGAREDGAIYPIDPHSYRGHYADLAFRGSCDPISVEEFLEVCENALGATFEGYKGGDFVMDERTPLWCAEWGDIGRAIIDTREAGGALILVTAREDR